MRKNLLIGLFIFFVLATSTYLYLVGREYELRFTEAELQAKLSERLPLTKTYLFIFNVVLDEPRLALVDGSDRVNAGLNVTLNIWIDDEQLPLGGTLDVSGGVIYENSTGQYFLTDPAIENFDVQGVPSEYSDRVVSVLTKAIGQYYMDHPIYTLRSSDPKQAAAKLVLKKVIVENRVLVITLGI